MILLIVALVFFFVLSMFEDTLVIGVVGAITVFIAIASTVGNDIADRLATFEREHPCVKMGTIHHHSDATFMFVPQTIGKTTTLQQVFIPETDYDAQECVQRKGIDDGVVGEHVPGQEERHAPILPTEPITGIY